MTIRNTYSAESWDKIYSAFSQINFTSYDYDTIKSSLISYLQIYYPETYNDFIESSELIALLELFAYTAELLAYRTDMMAHENFITTAQRKQSILRMAKLISYTAARNIPGRGLVKITSVRTSEPVYDSLGNNLANISVLWNDPNNSNWKEQFFLVINRCLTSRFGQPSKSFQVGDVLMQQYTFNTAPASFRNGVFPFSAVGSSEQVQMEVVAADIDENGPSERAPDLNSQFSLIYASDGKGDGSDYTGFLMFVKQGTLIRTDYAIVEPTANRRIELDQINVNDTDVWVYRVDDTGTITESWKRVETLNEQNLYFNNDNSTRKKYQVETLENDRIALLFGDGNFSDAPVGQFQLWTRVSANQSLSIAKNRVVDQAMGFSYTTRTNSTFRCDLTFSLTAAIQNNSASESIEHIRQAAPSTYYSQNRMVNGQDYNTFMLKDPTILRLKTINRTFAGQPKYIEWNDASGAYENIKLFGDDLTLHMDIAANSVETTSSSRTIIDSIIEPLLQSNALLNTLTHVMATSENSDGIISYPRRKFIEDNRTIYKDVDGSVVNPYGFNLNDITGTSSAVTTADGSLNEKSAIQCALDRHWYGDPLSYAVINGIQHGVISDPTLYPADDGKLYAESLPRTIDGVNTYPPGDVGSGLQQIQNYQFFGLRFNRFLAATGTGSLVIQSTPVQGVDSARGKKETITIEMTSDLSTFTVISSVRGRLPSYSLTLGGRWSAQAADITPFDFQINYTAGTDVAFAAGDAFVIDITLVGGNWAAALRTFGSLNSPRVNLNGWWEVIPESAIKGENFGAGLFNAGPNDGPTRVQQMTFDASDRALSWIFLVARTDSSGGGVDHWTVYNRDMKIIAASPTTKFWYNQDVQIIDSQTKKPVFDKIRILRSNLDENGQPLQRADIYDAVGLVYDTDGTVNFNQLEVLPTDTISWTQAGDLTPDNILQFENFSAGSYEYGSVASDGVTINWLPCGSYTHVAYDTAPYDSYPYDFNGIVYGGVQYAFKVGDFVGAAVSGASSVTIVRRRAVPAPSSNIPSNNDYTGCNVDTGLDFMWQHFSPNSNLIDPSVTNIHDAFILTSGYYNNMIEYVKGSLDVAPTAPTPLELRTAYGYLLKNKMLSDTVVMHSGSIKLLFGQLADQKLRAKFRVVRAPGASYSDERIRSEIVSVIDTYFGIENWDFGDTFYATELISLIHQRLGTQIASVVLVPTYSVNSFGSLFTIESGMDEILQSAATVDDVEIVAALTPTVLRQVK